MGGGGYWEIKEKGNVLERNSPQPTKKKKNNKQKQNVT